MVIAALNTVDREALLRAERENASLRRAITLLHRIANLSQESLELRPVCYAALTGVTAGVGLGLNRAMLFFAEPPVSAASSLQGRVLRGEAAIGPVDREEADRVWRSIEAEDPDLRTLYEAGFRMDAQSGALDQRVRELEVAASGDSPVARALRQRRVVTGGGGDDLGGLLDPPTAIAAPLRGRLGIHGVIYADNVFTELTIDPITALVFGMVADHTALAIENARRFEDVARAARTDALTGLGHHGALMEALAVEVQQARDTQEPLSVVMIDLDDFKTVNDTHGHPLGDRLLMAVADRLRHAARKGSVFRYGGEEFTVLLPGASRSDAAVVAERLRVAIGEALFELEPGPSLQVTCSLGGATLGPEHDASTLIERADRALLRAKNTGKDRVVMDDA